tara:strand:+ start:146 stop:1123 length:978 start_codon:yes stop_codon:yes gene_type:complete
MPASGGSVTDNSVPTNKVVDGKSHYLAYITPDEGKSLVDQGGVPTMTNEGIMAYPPQGQAAQHGGTERSSTPSTDNSADRGGNVHRATAQSYSPPSQDTSRDTPDDVADTAVGYDHTPRTNIEDIHGEWDDPDSKSYDPTYNPVTQAKATKKSAFGSGKHSGAYIWDSKNQEYFRVQDYTWKEHYDRAPDIIKWSPTLRSIYATGKNIGEWATRKGWTYDSKTGTVNDGQGNNVGERDLMNAASADAPYVASGTPTKSAPDSMAAKWFNQLGGSAGNFNLTSAFADAKAKQQQILGNTTPVGLLAAGNTPYFDFLQKHSLTKGIL